jgi:hypothetical protein
MVAREQSTLIKAHPHPVLLTEKLANDRITVQEQARHNFKPTSDGVVSENNITAAFSVAKLLSLDQSSYRFLISY